MKRRLILLASVIGLAWLLPGLFYLFRPAQDIDCPDALVVTEKLREISSPAIESYRVRSSVQAVSRGLSNLCLAYGSEGPKKRFEEFQQTMLQELSEAPASRSDLFTLLSRLEELASEFERRLYAKLLSLEYVTEIGSEARVSVMLSSGHVDAIFVDSQECELESRELEEYASTLCDISSLTKATLTEVRFVMHPSRSLYEHVVAAFLLRPRKLEAHADLVVWPSRFGEVEVSISEVVEEERPVDFVHEMTGKNTHCAEPVTRQWEFRLPEGFEQTGKVRLRDVSYFGDVSFGDSVVNDGVFTITAKLTNLGECEYDDLGELVESDTKAIISGKFVIPGVESKAVQKMRGLNNFPLHWNRVLEIPFSKSDQQQFVTIRVDQRPSVTINTSDLVDSGTQTVGKVQVGLRNAGSTLFVESAKSPIAAAN